MAYRWCGSPRWLMARSTKDSMRPVDDDNDNNDNDDGTGIDDDDDDDDDDDNNDDDNNDIETGIDGDGTGID